MNKIRNTILTLLICQLSLDAFSQGFTIEGTDATAFPGVTIRIQNKTGKALEKSAVSLMEGKNAIPEFNLSIAKTAKEGSGNADNETASGGGAVLFLIENGGFTSAQQVAAAKTAIANVLRNTKEGTVANVCYFNHTRTVGAMNRVSSEFTTDYPNLITDINRRVGHISEEKPAADLYKALYECIEFMSGKGNLDGAKQIILIATGMNNGGSPINLRDCTELATKNEIKVNGIGFRSADINATDNVKIAAQNMDGRYEAGESAADIERAMSTFIGSVHKASEAEKPTPAITGSFYTITYNSLGETGDKPTIQLKIGDSTKQTSFEVPADAKTSRERSSTKYYLIIGGALLVAIVLGILAARNNKKKKAEKEAARIRQEAEQRRIAVDAEAKRRDEEIRRNGQQASQQLTQFAASPQAEAIKGDHRTVVGGMNMPQLFVTAAGITQTYNLNGNAMKIGRDATNDIVINSPNVSRQHATIGMEGGQWYIIDNGSTNGVMIGGQRVQKSTITNGKQILLGDAICTIAF